MNIEKILEAHPEMKDFYTALKKDFIAPQMKQEFIDQQCAALELRRNSKEFRNAALERIIISQVIYEKSKEIYTLIDKHGDSGVIHSTGELRILNAFFGESWHSNYFRMITEALGSIVKVTHSSHEGGKLASEFKALNFYVNFFKSVRNNALYFSEEIEKAFNMFEQKTGTKNDYLSLLDINAAIWRFSIVLCKFPDIHTFDGAKKAQTSITLTLLKEISEKTTWLEKELEYSPPGQEPEPE